MIIVETVERRYSDKNVMIKQIETGTNPITTGNGNEVYAIATAI